MLANSTPARLKNAQNLNFDTKLGNLRMQKGNGNNGGHRASWLYMRKQKKRVNFF